MMTLDEIEENKRARATRVRANKIFAAHLEDISRARDLRTESDHLRKVARKESRAVTIQIGNICWNFTHRQWVLIHILNAIVDMTIGILIYRCITGH